MVVPRIVEPSFKVPNQNQRVSIYENPNCYNSRDQSLYQSYFSNDSISEPKKIQEVASLTGRGNIHPSMHHTPEYYEPGYISPKVNQLQPWSGQVINNPNDLMHTFSLHRMIMSWRGVYIKQKIEFMEAITGCETGNKYMVYERGNHGRRRGKEMLKCKEYSSCCARNCTTGGCRPFKMRVFNLWNHESKCLEMDRECQVTCACFNRPSMQVYYTEDGTREYLGRVVDNFDCCNYSFKVQNNENVTIFYIEASCLQCGLCCQCPCQSCERVTFNMWRGDKKVRLNTPLVKYGKKNCIKNAFTDADNFSVPYPEGSDFEERCLLLATALFIDYRMFESSPQGKERGGPSYGR